MSDKEKKKLTFDETIKALEKKYGKGTVIHGSKPVEDLECIDTGSVGLNHALGTGGLAIGKMIEVFGWESSGKSTLCQTIIGNAQRQGMKCVYVDAENSLDRKYATNLGVDMDDLYIIQMDESAGEGAFNKVDALVETGEVGLVVYDSYNALQPKAVVEGEVGDAAIGRHARMLGQAVIKANYLSMKYNTTFIFIGQLREKIGVMFGSPETTQGGNALKFYCHVRLRVSRSMAKGNVVMDGKTKIGNKTKINVVKNKLAPPFTSCSFDITYGKGIDTDKEIMELAKAADILSERAGIVTYDEVKYPADQFKEMLEGDFRDKLKELIMSNLVEVIEEVEEDADA